MKNTKLYVITRQDLPEGAQAAQSCHAAIKFSLVHPELTREWSDASNNIALLAVPDEATLARVLEAASALGTVEDVRAVFFREPDLGDSLTAIALYGDVVRRVVSSLPCALRPQRRAAVQRYASRIEG